MKKSTSLNTFYMTLIYGFLYAPILVLMIYSFNNADYSLVWHGFTTEWYHDLFQDSSLWIAALHSVVVAVIAASLATLIGTLAAVSLYRYRFMGKGIINGMVFILIVTPDIVLGISLLLLFSVFDLPLGFWSLLLAHITFCIPFVVVTLYSRITGLDKNIFEAAKDLGAKEWRIFKEITVPLLLPAIISAILLCFTLSFDDVMISYFISGPSFEILPLKIYSMARLGVKPELNALCTVTFLVTLTMVILSQKITRKK